MICIAKSLGLNKKRFWGIFYTRLIKFNACYVSIKRKPSFDPQKSTYLVILIMTTSQMHLTRHMSMNHLVLRRTIIFILLPVLFFVIFYLQEVNLILAISKQSFILEISLCFLDSRSRSNLVGSGTLSDLCKYDTCEPK